MSAVALASFLVACGSDGDDAASTTAAPAAPAATDATTIATEAAPGEGEPPALCAAWVTTDRVGSSLGDPDAPPEVVQEATEALADALEGVEAPQGLEAQLATANEAVAAALEGDPAAFESPEFTAAVAELGAWVHDECGFEQVEVTTVDHAFEGLGGPIAAGTVSFHLVNDGAEAHVIVLQRFLDDSEATAEDLFAADEAEGSAVEDETEPVVSGAFAAPGGEGYLTAELDPGRYVVLCPIPVGFTGDGPPPDDAPPHLALGMYAEFTVA